MNDNKSPIKEVVLTDLQKNVAVRMVLGAQMKDLTKEFNITLQMIADWIKCGVFIAYKDSLANENRTLVMQYLQSKQMKWLGRLDVLSDNTEDLKVSRQASVDLLGFAGMENKNVPAPPVITTNVYADKTEKELDQELDEVDGMIEDEETTKEVGPEGKSD